MSTSTTEKTRQKNIRHSLILALIVFHLNWPKLVARTDTLQIVWFIEKFYFYDRRERHKLIYVNWAEKNISHRPIYMFVCVRLLIHLQMSRNEMYARKDTKIFWHQQWPHAPKCQMGKAIFVRSFICPFQMWMKNKWNMQPRHTQFQRKKKQRIPHFFWPRIFFKNETSRK